MRAARPPRAAHTIETIAAWSKTHSATRPCPAPTLSAMASAPMGASASSHTALLRCGAVRPTARRMRRLLQLPRHSGHLRPTARTWPPRSRHSVSHLSCHLTRERHESLRRIIASSAGTRAAPLVHRWWDLPFHPTCPPHASRPLRRSSTRHRAFPLGR